MEKRKNPFLIVVVMIFMVTFFLIGLKIGGDYTISSNNLFEQAKSEFEEEIVKQDNNYQNKILYPEEKIPNKIAHKIDDIMQSIVDKIFTRN